MNIFIGILLTIVLFSLFVGGYFFIPSEIQKNAPFWFPGAGFFLCFIGWGFCITGLFQLIFGKTLWDKYWGWCTLAGLIATVLTAIYKRKREKKKEEEMQQYINTHPHPFKTFFGAQDRSSDQQGSQEHSTVKPNNRDESDSGRFTKNNVPLSEITSLLKKYPGAFLLFDTDSWMSQKKGVDKFFSSLSNCLTRQNSVCVLASQMDELEKYKGSSKQRSVAAAQDALRRMNELRKNNLLVVISDSFLRDSYQTPRSIWFEFIRSSSTNGERFIVITDHWLANMKLKHMTMKNHLQDKIFIQKISKLLKAFDSFFDIRDNSPKEKKSTGRLGRIKEFWSSYKEVIFLVSFFFIYGILDFVFFNRRHLA